MKKCRCCNSDFPDKPVLRYENMPGLAQNFPEHADLGQEQGIDLQIYQCPYCGLVQILQEPVYYYRNVIRSVGISSDMKEFRREYFKNFIQSCNLEGKKILEVGAGAGEYMEMIGENGVRVFGLENSVSLIKSAVEKGLQVFEGFVEHENYQIPEAPYDGFYIMNFLEHIPEPLSFLKGISNNLCEGAYGLIEVPNGDRMMKEGLFSEFMLDHLSYFTANTLRTVLEIAGFEVLQCDVVWYENILSALVRKRMPFDPQNFMDKQNAVLEQLEQYLSAMEQKNKRVAVWGASHHALALMSLARLQERIVCVIDSAPFKQNKYTPATHIPVCSPEQMQEYGVGAVIIMAGSYAEEIKRELAKNYSHIEYTVF